MQRTEETPMVHITEGTDSHTVHIKGVSMPENTTEFYEPLKEKFNRFIKEELATTLIVELDYMNSMSNKQVLKLIDMFSKKCKDFNVLWKHAKDDELIKMKGEEIQLVMKGTKIVIEEI